MEYKNNGSIIAVRLERGEEIISSLTNLASKEKIRFASVQGIGASDHTVIGVFDTNTKQYCRRELNVPMEITNICGNISRKDGEPYLHLHITLGDAEGNVYAGHLNECYISVTSELVLQTVDIKTERLMDDSVGINLLHFH